MAREHAVIKPRFATFGRRALAFELLSGLEHVEHVSDRFGLVAGLHHVLEAEPIGFHLVFATVPAHPRLGADVGELPDGIRAGEDGRGHRTERSGHAARLAAGRMARGDVSDFVADHARELGLGVEAHAAGRD